MEDFVNFSIAKKLKEKGFREDCIAYYHTDGELLYNRDLYRGGDYKSLLMSYNSLPKNPIGCEQTDAPTISQTLKWLIEEKNIILTPNPSYFKEDCCLGWDCDVWASGNYDYCCVDYKTYEQASLAGIEYILDDLI